MQRFAIIDFETTGLSPRSDRIIEVAAAIVEDGQVVDTFSELMNPGFRVPFFITDLTGISDAMLRGKPAPEKVMPHLRRFLGDHHCVAHNASFDQGFFTAEMLRAQEHHDRNFVCSMLLARRLLPEAPNHKLGNLVRHLGLKTPPGLTAHRALADVLMTCALWQHLSGIFYAKTNGKTLNIQIIQKLMKTPKKTVDTYLMTLAGSGSP